MWDEPDDIVIEWARKQDVFSDQVVYEIDVSFGARGHGDTRKHAEAVDGVIDIDQDTLGSFREQEAVEECRRLGLVLLERILLILADGDAFNEAFAPPHYFTFFTPESWVRRLRALGQSIDQGSIQSIEVERELRSLLRDPNRPERGRPGSSRDGGKISSVHRPIGESVDSGVRGARRGHVGPRVPG